MQHRPTTWWENITTEIGRATISIDKPKHEIYMEMEKGIF